MYGCDDIAQIPYDLAHQGTVEVREFLWVKVFVETNAGGWPRWGLGVKYEERRGLRTIIKLTDGATHTKDYPDLDLAYLKEYHFDTLRTRKTYGWGPITWKALYDGPDMWQRCADGRYYGLAPACSQTLSYRIEEWHNPSPIAHTDSTVTARGRMWPGYRWYVGAPEWPLLPKPRLWYVPARGRVVAW